MLKSIAMATLARRSARFLPGGWVTMIALHPRSRQIGAAAARRGWREFEKRRAR